jgi:phage replication-related protein YjqB (UPF0714/DUF867 family)
LEGSSNLRRDFASETNRRVAFLDCEMPDKYESFSELARSAVEGRDYRIRMRERVRGATSVIAIHGGGIEPGTSEVAEAIAADDLSFYAFEGIKAAGNGDLHITSHRFSEPQCITLVTASSRVISIHGEDSDGQVTFLGGKDRKTLQALRKSLTGAGFTVEIHQRHDLQGLDAENICNRGENGCGIQLELSYGLRRSFFKSLSRSGRRVKTAIFDRFVTSVRAIL